MRQFKVVASIGGKKEIFYILARTADEAVRICTARHTGCMVYSVTLEQDNGVK